jgi:hypothetical protein
VMWRSRVEGKANSLFDATASMFASSFPLRLNAHVQGNHQTHGGCNQSNRIVREMEIMVPKWCVL